MAYTAKDIKDLRERTNAGILDCKNALSECDGDIDKAIDWLRQKGLSAAAKKAGRIASEGVVSSYIHGKGKIGVLIEVNCETDFVAKNENFNALVKDIAMQIAAHSPKYVNIEDISAEEIAHERSIQKSRVLDEGKPEAFADKIVDGRMSKYYEEVVLLEQTYFRDESLKIKDLISQQVATIGEKINVRRFIRWELGEGLEKRKDDFVEEVMAQMKQ